MRKLLFICGVLFFSEIAIADASHALTLTLSNGTTGTGGVTNQGSFVDSFTPAETIDFNSTATGDFASGSNTFALTSGSVTLTAVPVSTPINLNTQFRQDSVNAPKGPGPAPTAFQDNASTYLAVFAGIDVDLTFTNTVAGTTYNSVSLFGVDFGEIDSNNRIILNTIDNASTVRTYTVALNAADATTGFALSSFTNPRTGALLARNDDAFITLVSDVASGERITKVTLRQDTTANAFFDQFGAIETDNYAFTFYPTNPTAVPFEFSPLTGLISLAALYKIRKFMGSKKNQ